MLEPELSAVVCPMSDPGHPVGWRSMEYIVLFFLQFAKIQFYYITLVFYVWLICCGTEVTAASNLSFRSSVVHWNMTQGQNCLAIAKSLACRENFLFTATQRHVDTMLELSGYPQPSTTTRFTAKAMYQSFAGKMNTKKSIIFHVSVPSFGHILWNHALAA